MTKTAENVQNTADVVENLFLHPSDIALLFRRAEPTIREWASKSKARKIKEGNRVRYYLPDIFEYYENEIVSYGSEDLDKVRAELEKVKLEKEKINLAILKEEYVKREQVEIEWAQRASELRQGLIALEYRLASQLANRRLSISKVREIVRKEVLALLRAYTTEGKYTPPLEGVSNEEFEKHYFEFLRKLESKTNGKRKKSIKSS